jgi:predicted nucleic acid-binding protein
MKLLDSSILIDYARGEQAAREFLEAEDAVFGASTVVLAELYMGLFVTTEMDREAVLSKYAWVRTVPFTNEAAAEAAKIRATLRSRGTPIDKSDTYIAGTARAFDVPLVTADDHFERIDDLQVELYEQ